MNSVDIICFCHYDDHDNKAHQNNETRIDSVSVIVKQIACVLKNLGLTFIFHFRHNSWWTYMVFRFKFIKMCFAFFRRIGTKLTC